MTGAAAPSRDQPLVLIGRDRQRQVVLAANAAAQKAGLQAGMPASKAQALVPGLVMRDADPDADAASLEKLAVWALRYSPVVAADFPDGIVIDATGAAHLHGGEDAMIADIVSRLNHAGTSATASIADSWGAAHALARFTAPPTLVVAGAEGARLILDLPVAALRLPPGIIDNLRRLGFERVSDVAAAPRATLTLRFGPELIRRLDQALGRTGEPINPVRPADTIETYAVFAEPIGAAETIQRNLTKLVLELCVVLERKQLGSKRLDLIIERVDNTIQAVRVGTARPVRECKRLTRLLSDKIETIDPGFGIERMRLAATLTEPLGGKQSASSLIDDAEADVSSLIDTLANRVGEEKLYRFAAVESDVPERSVARVAALAAEESGDWPEHWPRPSRLLSPPESIETVALLPDHPPVNFTWRGSRRRVRRADGPERIFGEWWKRDSEIAAVRDYFQVEDEEGGRYWIFRAGDGEDPGTGNHRWFLHGIFG